MSWTEDSARFYTGCREGGLQAHHEVDDEDEEGGRGELHGKVRGRARKVEGAEAVHAAGTLLQHHLELAAAHQPPLSRVSRHAVAFIHLEGVGQFDSDM